MLQSLQPVLHRWGPEIAKRTYEHIYLTFVAMLIAVIIAVPLGIYLTRTRWPGLVSAVLGAASVTQTIPGLALIGYIVAIFVLVPFFPTIGPLPGLVAFVLYALLPILRNTYTGIRQVDASLIEVATGMGMKPRQILFQVELPLSLPVIMAGIRISMVWTIGIVALGGLIGAGGLGDPIIKGLRNYRIDYLLAGGVPAAALALIFDWLLASAERLLTPTGLKAAPGS